MTPSDHPPTVNELTDDELDQVSGGFSFLGGFGSIGGSVNLGPLSFGGGLAHGGPNGDIYGTVNGGGSPTSASHFGLGVSGGVQANVAFGFGNHTFDDVVTGPSTVIEFGYGSIAYNENGFTLGLGRTGVGISHSDTVNLSHQDPPPGVQEALDSLNHPQVDLPPPQLKDWSDSFGPHELENMHGAQNAADNHGTQGATDNHGTQDAADNHPPGATDNHQDPVSLAGDPGPGVPNTSLTVPNTSITVPDTSITVPDPGSLVGDPGPGVPNTSITVPDPLAGDPGPGVPNTSITAPDPAPVTPSPDTGSTFGNDFGDPNSGFGDFGGDFGGDIG